MESSFINILWEQTNIYLLLTAFLAGIVVSYIYFSSLHWSIKHLGEFKHKYRMFAFIALLRVILFFTILVLVCQRNVILILFYVLAFFIMRILYIWRIKVIEDKEEDRANGLEN